MIQQKACSLRTRRNRNFYTMVLHSICAKFGKDPTDLRDLPLNFATRSQFTSDCLWASFWLSKDQEEFKRVAMIKSLPITQVFIQSVQRQGKTLIERKDAHNMQVSQDWNTFRFSRRALLGDPAAKLIRLKVDVFSDSTLCVGVSKPDPSNNWTTTLEERMERTRICWNNQFGSWRGAIHLARVAYEIKKHVQKYLNGQNPESFEKIILVSLFNDGEWTKKDNTETCFCDSVQARTLVLLGACVRKDAVERTFQRTSRKIRYCRMVEILGPPLAFEPRGPIFAVAMGLLGAHFFFWKKKSSQKWVPFFWFGLLFGDQTHESVKLRKFLLKHTIGRLKRYVVEGMRFGLCFSQNEKCTSQKCIVFSLKGALCVLCFLPFAARSENGPPAHFRFLWETKMDQEDHWELNMCCLWGSAACSARSGADSSPVGGPQQIMWGHNSPTCHLHRWAVIRLH